MVRVVLTRHATALAWLAFIGAVVTEVARVALGDAGVIGHVLVIDGCDAIR